MKAGEVYFSIGLNSKRISEYSSRLVTNHVQTGFWWKGIIIICFSPACTTNWFHLFIKKNLSFLFFVPVLFLYVIAYKMQVTLLFLWKADVLMCMNMSTAIFAIHVFGERVALFTLKAEKFIQAVWGIFLNVCSLPDISYPSVAAQWVERLPSRFSDVYPSDSPGLVWLGILE